LIHLSWVIILIHIQIGPGIWKNSFFHSTLGPSQKTGIPTQAFADGACIACQTEELRTDKTGEMLMKSPVMFQKVSYEKNPTLLSIIVVVYRDPYIGLLKSPYTWVA